MPQVNLYYNALLRQLRNLQAAAQLVLPGGTTGQVYAKRSNADFDAQWVDPTGGATPPIGWVTVSNPATDVRPGNDHVIWVGGSTKPTNMTTADLWVKG